VLAVGCDCEAALGQLAQGLGVGRGAGLVVVDEPAGARVPDPKPEPIGSRHHKGYFSRREMTAVVMASTPVRIAGSGSGANSLE